MTGLPLRSDPSPFLQWQQWCGLGCLIIYHSKCASVLCTYSSWAQKLSIALGKKKKKVSACWSSDLTRAALQSGGVLDLYSLYWPSQLTWAVSHITLKFPVLSDHSLWFCLQVFFNCVTLSFSCRCYFLNTNTIELRLVIRKYQVQKSKGLPVFILASIHKCLEQFWMLGFNKCLKRKCLKWELQVGGYTTWKNILCQNY